VLDLLEQGACTLGAFAVCSVMATIALQLGLFSEHMDNVARSIVVLMACVPMAGNTVVIANCSDLRLKTHRPAFSGFFDQE
jgi:predicted permease